MKGFIETRIKGVGPVGSSWDEERSSSHYQTGRQTVIVFKIRFIWGGFKHGRVSEESSRMAVLGNLGAEIEGHTLSAQLWVL